MMTQCLHAIYLAMLEFERPMLGVQTSSRKALNNLSGFVVCYCKFNHVCWELMACSELSHVGERYAVSANGSDCFRLPESRHLVHYRTATLANFWEWSLCARMPFNKSAIVLSPSRQQTRHCEAFAGRNFDCIRSWWGLHLNGEQTAHVRLEETRKRVFFHYYSRTTP